MLNSFLSSHKGLLAKTLWPRKLSGVGKVTGLAAVLSDVVNFITNKALPPSFLFLISLLVFLFFCRRLWLEIYKEELPYSSEKVNFFYDKQGENTRFIFLVMIGFMIVWISFITVGAESFSEKILKKLNIIEGKLDDTHDELIGVRDKVINIEKLLQAGTTIKDPNSAAEYYVNARLSEGTDPRQTFKILSDSYDRFGTGRMDSAEMFLRYGKQFIGSKKIRALMQRHYDKKGDLALLYYINFSVRDPEERRAAYQKMHEKFPDYPPSYIQLDPLNVYSSKWVSPTRTKEEKLLTLQRGRKIIQQFLEIIDDSPTSNYYYAHAPDWERMAVSRLNHNAIAIKNVESAIEREKARGAAREARKTAKETTRRLKAEKAEKAHAAVTAAREAKRAALHLKLETAEKDGKAALEAALNVKPELSNWRFRKGGQGQKDTLFVNLKSAPFNFSGAKKFTTQFTGQEMKEFDRFQGDFRSAPPKGTFTLNWQDRNGTWHGPFTYIYDTQKTP